MAAAPSAYQFAATTFADAASQSVAGSASKTYNTTMAAIPAALTKLYGMLTVFAACYGAAANGTYMTDTNSWTLTGTFNVGGFTGWNVANVTCNGSVNNSTMPASDTTNISTGAAASTWRSAPFGAYGMPNTSYSCFNSGFSTTAGMRCTYTITLSGYYPAGMMCIT